MPITSLVSLSVRSSPGWCSKVTYRDGSNVGSIDQLAQRCPDLQKLFLTANRSIVDEDLMALAKHCPKLEQLDLLGNNAITTQGVRMLLKSCQKLKFLDLSFCSAITAEFFSEMEAKYPTCSLKKSFT